MKKSLILFVLLLSLLVAFVGCGQNDPQQTGDPTGDTAAGGSGVDTLSVGYARVDITPKGVISLGGSLTRRLSDGILDPLYVTCISFTDGDGNTVLFMPLDLLASYGEVIPRLRADISEETGVPMDNIITTASHNHSGPHLSYTEDPAIQEYTKMFKERAMQAAKESLADRKPAKIYTGYTRLENMNYVRHYLLDNGTYAGSNFGDFDSGRIVGHATKADNLLQVVKFDREGGKDVLLTNWQGHYRLGWTTKVSSDFFGVMRSTLEAELDCLFAYVAGAGGNVNNRSLIKSEPSTADYVAHGKALSEAVVEVLKTVKEAKVGKVQTLKGTYSAYFNGSSTMKLDIPLNTFAVGDVAFACAPYEMFDTNGITIRENSDFQMTFVATQSNAHLNYVPTPDAYDYESYEARYTRVAKGSAEGLADKFVSMLGEMYAKTGLTPVQKDDSFYTKPVEPATDGKLYTNPNVGDLTAYKETPCGAMQIQLVGPEGTLKILVQTKELAEKILQKETVRLVFSYCGIVTDILAE